MAKRSTDDGRLNGLPTAILYLGCYGIMGCLAFLVFAAFVLLTTGYLWVWLRFCDWSGLSVAMPAKIGRVLLGALLYLVIVVPIGLKLWQQANEPRGE